jgi:hypothetical protein
MKFQRYSEGDISESAPSVTLGLPGHGVSLALAIACAAGVVLIIIVFIARRGSKQAALAPRYARPRQATVFNVLSLLQQIHADPSLKLSQQQRSELQQSIRDLEQGYFARNGAAAKPDLENILTRWCEVCF